MESTGRILLHLAAVLAGWGIVQSQQPASPETAGGMAPGKASVREARDREAGEKLLRRLVPDLAPAPPVEVGRHEGTLEERVKKMIDEDPFAADAAGMFPVDFVRCIREEIDDTILGVDGPDLSCAFRHGRLDARQILASLHEIFPDLATEALFTTAVYLELFQIDPTRAADLLDGVPPEDRDSFLLAVVDGETWSFELEVSLARLNAELSLGMGTKVGSMQDAGASHSTIYYMTFGNDYTEWLLDQPPSPGRQEMLDCLAHTLKAKDPAAGAALKKRLSNR